MKEERRQNGKKHKVEKWEGDRDEKKVQRRGKRRRRVVCIAGYSGEELDLAAV